MKHVVRLTQQSSLRSLLWCLKSVTPFLYNYYHCRFVLLNAGVIYFYVLNFQSIDEEEYGGMWEITKEGFMTSFAGFLVRFFIYFVL